MTQCDCCLGHKTMLVCPTCGIFIICWSDAPYVDYRCPHCGTSLYASGTCTKCGGVGTILDIGFAADKTSGPPLLTVTFTGNVTQAGVSPYSWVLDYGDGASESGSGSSLTRSHVYNKSATAKLTVTDALGGMTSQILGIFIVPSEWLPYIQAVGAVIPLIAVSSIIIGQELMKVAG